VGPADASFLREFYDDYPRIEEAFQAALDESLHPRGPDLLYEIVAGRGLPAGASVVDLGCGEGRQALELAKRFGCAVLGIDPVARQIELCNERLAAEAERDPGLRERVRFELASAESLPLDDASVDLIWCREVLYVIPAIEAALAECRRVLRPGGQMLVYQHFATDRLESAEAARLWPALGVVPANAETTHVEAAFARAGFEAVQRIDLGTEFGQYSQEVSGEPGRRLLHAARLLLDPERYVSQFGQTAYDIMLADCLWHIYRLIGKLSSRVYLLRAS
jgi:ubiquinone/menaquinone biosynthesis C-methylase UbiE